MDKARHPHVIRTWAMPRNRGFQPTPLLNPKAKQTKGFRKPAPPARPVSPGRSPQSD